MCVFFSLLSDRFADYDNLRNILLQSSATTIGSRRHDLRHCYPRHRPVHRLDRKFRAGGGHLPGGHEIGRGNNHDTSYFVYPIALAAGLGLALSTLSWSRASRLVPLIATLGTLTLYRGLGLHLTDAALLSVRGPILEFARGQLFGIGLPVYAAVAMVALGWLLLAQTVFGRRILALGGSPALGDGDRHEDHRTAARCLRVVGLLRGASQV